MKNSNFFYQCWGKNRLRFCNNTRAIFVNHHRSPWNKVKKLQYWCHQDFIFEGFLLGYKVRHLNAGNGRFKDVLILLFNMLSLSGIWAKQRTWDEWSCHYNFIIKAVANCTTVKLSGSLKFAFLHFDHMTFQPK